jgi:hypothetical protein
METLSENIVGRISPEILSFTIVGFSQATGIGTSTLYEDAKTGKLRTRLLGDGRRKKRLVMREDGVDYLRAFPVSEVVV